MIETPPSLLVRLRATSDSEAWSRLIQLYSPWVAKWIRRAGLAATDSEDLAQDVLTEVVRAMRTFEYDPAEGMFRCWLRTVTTNCLRKFWRKKRPIAFGAGREGDAVESKLD